MFYACPTTTVEIAGCYTSNGQVVGATGDQYLVLFDESGNLVASNDDGWGDGSVCGYSSYISYTVPSTSKCQTYSLRQGCYDTTSCSGEVVVFELVVDLLALSYCLPGTYLSTLGDSCIKCSQNTYSSGYDDVCKSCPANSWASSGSSTCTCNKGFSQSGFGESLTCSSCGSSYIYTSQTCPSNYIMQNPYSYFPKCYQYVVQSKSYGDAVVYCNSNSGWLVTISNKAESNLVSSLHQTTQIWIGLNDAKREGSYNWVSPYSGGVPFNLIAASTYQNYSWNEPNDWSTGEDCIQQYHSGYWNDNRCDQYNPLICETSVIDTCQSTSSSANKVPLQILCDNFCKVYINGLYIGYSSSWAQSTLLAPTINSIDVVAIEAIDAVESDENYSGFAITLSYSTGNVYSSTQWKCSNVQTTTLPSGWNLNSFDDSSWSYASSYGATSSTSTRWSSNDMNNNAQFIWTSDNFNHNHILCRYKQPPPTAAPTFLPTKNPTPNPTLQPTPNPTPQPTPNPTPQPTQFVCGASGESLNNWGVKVSAQYSQLFVCNSISYCCDPRCWLVNTNDCGNSNFCGCKGGYYTTYIIATSSASSFPTNSPTYLPTVSPTFAPTAAPTRGT